MRYPSEPPIQPCPPTRRRERDEPSSTPPTHTRAINNHHSRHLTTTPFFIERGLVGEPWVPPRSPPCLSWRESAVSARALAIAWTAAAAPEMVVMHGTRAASAASRIR